MQARFAIYNIYWQCLKSMAKTALPYGEMFYLPRATEIIYLKPICDYMSGYAQRNYIYAALLYIYSKNVDSRKAMKLKLYS